MNWILNKIWPQMHFAFGPFLWEWTIFIVCFDSELKFKRFVWSSFAHTRTQTVKEEPNEMKRKRKKRKFVVWHCYNFSLLLLLSSLILSEMMRVLVYCVFVLSAVIAHTHTFFVDGVNESDGSAHQCLPFDKCVRWLWIKNIGPLKSSILFGNFLENKSVVQPQIVRTEAIELTKFISIAHKHHTQIDNRIQQLASI